MGRKCRDGVVTVGDTDMYYASFGTGERHVVVLPGLSDGLTTVKDKAFMLASPYKPFFNDFTVYMFSRKNKMPEGYTIRQMAEDQVTAMRNLGIEKACVVGVSQGGMISQYIAIDHPEVVDKLVLAVTSPYVNDIATSVVSNWIEITKTGDHTALMLDTAEKMYSEAYLKKNRSLFPVIARFTKPADYSRFLINANAILGFDAREEICKIKCPTLVISGEDDKTVGNDAPSMFEQGISDCSVYIYEGLGHGAFEEAKDFYSRIYEFCRVC